MNGRQWAKMGMCVTELTRLVCAASCPPLWWKRTMSNCPVLDGGGLVCRQRTMSDCASPTLIPTPTDYDTLTLHGHHAVQSKDRTEGVCCRNGQLQDRGRILKRRGLACLTELPHLLLRGTIHSPNHCTAHILQSKNAHSTLLLGCHHKQKHKEASNIVMKLWTSP